jgi:cell wall-associated NlpC family hydrolase
MPANKAAIAGIAGSVLLIYSGVTGRSPLGAVKTLVTGKSPATAPIVNPITGSSAGALYGGNASANAIAQDALQYQGHPYLYGGAPGADGSQPWDCSSFVSWILGHDFGLALPGHSQRGYNGSEHGPTTLGYLIWQGARTIPFSRAQAGDLAVWQTHAGIFISPTEMISALNPQLGTQVTGVQGIVPGEILVVRRIKNLTG